MVNLFSSLFRSKNSALIAKMYKIVQNINSLEDGISKLNDNQLKDKTNQFKQSLQNKQTTLDKILPEAFAIVREAAKRVLGQRHFDVQLLGGITLHNSMIAEMLTGEGKTLVSTLPVYLNALEGKGVHVITVNDYLAKRDRDWMGQIFEFLGLSVGVIVSGMDDEQRRIAYACDITYGTNNEFGFDYLRDNMKYSLDQLVQRPFNYAVVDEIDSVLIDEARTPLIISGPSEDKTELYKLANGFVRFFQIDEDFKLDEKQKTINLTEEGLEKLEKVLKQHGLVVEGSLFDAHNIQLYHFVVQAIKCHYLYKKEVDYIVKDNHVVIIDEFTGRMMDGRRFSEGLHQALEAKEGIKIRAENQTLASITYQNYFKMYPKLCGMTGTAMTEAQEFVEIYGLKVVSIPSHRPVSRKDFNDKIYLTYKEKEKAIVEKIQECVEKKQPVLIGTVSIEKSELLSLALKKVKIAHNVLNAKNHEKEASIIAQAGALGAVTIATNMAGRGTDIQLGGNLDFKVQELNLENITEEEKNNQIENLKQQIKADKEKILQLGGLYVIGTERHESRRIDNQLRGRSGRQGESGASIFYIALDDDLMRVFGSNKLESMLKKLGFKEDESISHPIISRAIEKAQKRVEQYNFEIRKNLLRFDNVINEQRKVIYEQRTQIMNKEIDIMSLIDDSIDDMAESLVKNHMPQDQYREKWNYEALKADLTRLFNINDMDVKKLAVDDVIDTQDFIAVVKEKSQEIIDKKIKIATKPIFEGALREVSLQILDYSWKKHLLELDYVRGAINLRAYANKDPLNEYQKEAFVLFSDMVETFKEKLVSVVHHIEFNRSPREDSENNTATEKPQENTSKPLNLDQKVGRNDPCPCGSGKKYKHCHGN